MLDQITKQKLDSARNILVGKVPDPKAQVEQITTALVYKFMDDMDKEAEELGGEVKFFADGFAQYAWTKLLDNRLSGQKRLDLYAQAITSMSKNPHIPQLFRDIFKGAFLPYNDPRTLSLFLKQINEFNYEHSENLGNAFEYLLSILGSQGEAGQFRTPRHIIDFIVAVIDPKKSETILDPACGTAGFLISAYKHILKANIKKPLTSDEKTKLMNNLVGYDISPDMVKLALVNMYLHGFQDPKIHEYDTLSSEKRWSETFDVILANPPFMTPKGGIRPHKRFSVKANRSEVLFVDYIVEHLNINGRAGIIVPEGVVFKSDNAYKKLRKVLIDNGLFAVVSLPSGVFNPYAGVKTSILLFDNQVAKKTDEILFVKVESDGFDLGAQRRKVEKNDLPEALDILQAWKQSKKKESGLTLWVKKEKISENDDYNLTGERYKETEIRKNQKWLLVEIGEIAELGRGRVISKEYIHKNAGSYPVYSSQTQNNGEFGSIKTYDFEGEYVTWTTDGANAGRVFYRDGKFNCTNVCGTIKIKGARKVSPKYLAYVLNTRTKPFVSVASGNPKLMNNVMAKIKIPLPPLEVQKEIVEEIEQYQKVIDGAKQVVENYKPNFRIDPDWSMVELDELTEIARGGSPRPISKYITTDEENGINWIKIGDVAEGEKYVTKTKQKIKPEGLAKTRKVKKGDFILSNSMSFGRPYILKIDGAIHDGWLLIRINNDQQLLANYLYQILGNDLIKKQYEKLATGGVVKNLNSNLVRSIKIPLPPLEVQKQLVAEAEKEEEIITANKKLIEIMEQKISNVLNEI